MGSSISHMFAVKRFAIIRLLMVNKPRPRRRRTERHAMICHCGKKFRVLNVVPAVDSAKRRERCEGCGRMVYSIQQVYAEVPARPAFRGKSKSGQKKATCSTKATRSNSTR